MSSPFPLYNTIYKSTQSVCMNDLTDDEKEFFLSEIQHVKDYELFYMLIITHAREQDKNYDQYPYGGKELKKGIRFDLGVMPTHLKQILFNFLETYLKSN